MPRLARPRLPRRFYARPSIAVARAVLGRELVHDSPAGRTSGIIVETEAYCGAFDPASHAFRGRSARNLVMFGPPGFSYVYFIYGVHFCLNLVTEAEGTASAVLVRALEPVEGVELMSRRRGVPNIERLARGPGNVARALGLTREHNGLDLTRGPLYLLDRPPRRRGYPVIAGPRIGIRQAVERPWRFVLGGHPAASGPRFDPARRLRSRSGSGVKSRKSVDTLRTRF
jgi:DNA-3-methyladenine glycosylase